MTDADNNALSIWTIYERPSDYPRGYVARRHEVGKTSGPTRECIFGTLADLRETLSDRGLACIPRAAADEPQIVESWL